ncbi:MAG: DUF4398 domain-containing protein [bacterium]|nr:DUF4398 domain-containing protein [bacterium]
MRPVIAAASLILAIIAAGCSSNPPLRTDASSSAIHAAEAVGVEGAPRAALHLQLAKESLAQAQVLAEKGDRDEARSLLMRAQADAELAILLSREQSEKTEAALAVDKVRQLQQENR